MYDTEITSIVSVSVHTYHENEFAILQRIPLIRYKSNWRLFRFRRNISTSLTDLFPRNMATMSLWKQLDGKWWCLNRNYLCFSDHPLINNILGECSIFALDGVLWTKLRFVLIRERCKDLWNGTIWNWRLSFPSFNGNSIRLIQSKAEILHIKFIPSISRFDFCKHLRITSFLVGNIIRASIFSEKYLRNMLLSIILPKRRKF